MDKEKVLKISLVDYPDRYIYSVLKQTHRGAEFAPGNFDHDLNLYQNMSYNKYKKESIKYCFYNPSEDNIYVTYEINKLKICLYSCDHPEIRKIDKSHYIVFVRGKFLENDNTECTYYKDDVILPIEYILTAVNMYNFGYDNLRRISIKRKQQ